MIPFFVADRPMSLDALEYCGINHQNSKMGIMGHANTSQNFQIKFRGFPRENVVKMADSGVFSKNGCILSYEELFKLYENMDTDYGIMIDYLRDRKKTIESAKKCYGEV